VLAGGIAHDFNNLLTAIMGNVSMASAEAGDRAELRQFLHEADLACARARDLTQQLLTFSKGGAPIRKTALLRDVIHDSARFATHGSNARCECQLPADMWPVEADTGQISQVIQNIVINATQAMPEGGTIQIACRNIPAGDGIKLGLGPGRYVRISIQDQGSGIRPEHLAKIFDPYFSTKQRGSGLGLATVYSIVKRHEGTIKVHSQLGKGACFDIYLPASDHLPAIPSQSMPATRFSGSGHVLVMDDEQPVLKLVVKMLAKLGCQPLSAQDGAEAVRLYAEAKAQGRIIDAVILDLTVPGGMGGRQALKQMQAIDPAVKAIVSSGFSNDPIMAQYRDYGFAAVVPKPYGLDSLAAVLGEVLGAGAGVKGTKNRTPA
jgi:two-component system, cell cycle sensor histidine kinase and response regulator CckA